MNFIITYVGVSKDCAVVSLPVKIFYVFYVFGSDTFFLFFKYSWIW